MPEEGEMFEEKCRGCVWWQCGEDGLQNPVKLTTKSKIKEFEKQEKNINRTSEARKGRVGFCINNNTGKFLIDFFKVKESNLTELGSKVGNATEAKEPEINHDEEFQKSGEISLAEEKVKVNEENKSTFNQTVSKNKTNDNQRIVVHEGSGYHYGKKKVVREMNICFNNNKDRFLDLFLVQQKWSKKDESTNRKDVEQRIPREKEKSMIKNQHMTINNNTCANHNWKDIFGIVGNSADMSKLKLSKDRRRRRQAHTKSREK